MSAVPTEPQTRIASSVPRTLLLTGTRPTPDGVGGIILDDLCDFLPRDAVCVAWVQEGEGAPRETALRHGIPMRTVPVAFSRRPALDGSRLARIASWPMMRSRNQRRLKAALRDCVAWARRHGVEQVWAILDMPVSIELAMPLAAALGVPLRVTVWDDVAHNTRHFGLDRLTAAHVSRRFAEALRGSIGLAVIGETMLSEYRRRYGSEGVIVRHGVASVDSEASIAGTDGPVRIGFAGSVSARSAFELLLSTLDRMGWSIDGRRVILTVMGPAFDFRSGVERNIECLGWRAVEDTIRILSACTLNYLPQPFEPEWEPFSRLSFPSKLTTYLAAGAPVLLHAPEYASLPEFYREHPFGACCLSLDSQSLEQAIRLLALQDDARSSAKNAGRQALAREFTRDRFRESFAEFMGVPPSALK